MDQKRSPAALPPGCVISIRRSREFDDFLEVGFGRMLAQEVSHACANQKFFRCDGRG